MCGSLHCCRCGPCSVKMRHQLNQAGKLSQTYPVQTSASRQCQVCNEEKDKRERAVIKENINNFCACRMSTLCTWRPTATPATMPAMCSAKRTARSSTRASTRTSTMRTTSLCWAWRSMMRAGCSGGWAKRAATCVPKLAHRSAIYAKFHLLNFARKSVPSCTCAVSRTAKRVLLHASSNTAGGRTMRTCISASRWSHSSHATLVRFAARQD